MRKYLFSLLTLLTTIVFGQNVQISKPESWITENTKSDTHPEKDNIEQGSYLILLDEQVNVGLKKDYVHTIRQLTNENGVQENSQIEIQFDPAFEKINFHHIRIIRDGIVTDVLKLKDVKVMQQENNLSDFLYNGTSTALFILNDIRVGDQVDYDYTITGYNPVFHDKYYRTLYFQGGEPIGRLHYSVIMPAGRKLYTKEFNTPPGLKTEILSDGSTKYDWEKTDAQSHVSEDFEPEWFNDYPRTQLTEANSWKEIVDWAISINPSTNDLSPELRTLINKFREESNDKVIYLQKCVRFVQDNVRYMGIEISEHSHKPHAPNQIFSQRYGDCKDKSLLLCAMLKADSIEAYPAFVNTSMRGKMSESLPSAIQFNHCVCKIIIQGRELWIDPTISLQRGPILKTYFPNYERALVIKEGENDLTKITTSNICRTVISEKFNLEGVEGNGTLNVISKYYGYEADQMRNSVQNTSKTNLQSSYMDYYSNLYDSIRVKDPFKISDNEEENVIQIEESYKLSHPWKKDKKEKYYFEIQSSLISSHLVVLPNKERKNPIRLEYPCDVEYTVEIGLPSEWNITSEPIDIKSNFFNFSFEDYKIDKGITLVYKYKTFTNEVPVSMAAIYNKNCSEVMKNIGYTITWDQDLEASIKAGAKTNTKFIGIAFLLLVVFSLIALRVYKLKTETTTVERYDSIGGWMLLPFISLPIKLILIVFTMMTQNYFNQALLDNLLTKDEVSAAGWENALLFEIGGNILMFVLTALCIIAFIKRRDILPRLMVAFYAITAVIMIIDNLIVKNTGLSSPNDPNDAMRAVFACVIWIPFFLISDRVKQTFVVPYREDEKLNENVTVNQEQD